MPQIRGGVVFEQTSWIIFLKHLDDFEADWEAAAELAGKSYKNIYWSADVGREFD